MLGSLRQLPRTVWLLGQALGARRLALTAITRPLLDFATSWLMLLLLRFADRVGKGLRTSPRDALLALTVDPARRKLVFGFHRSLDNAARCCR